jgi:cytosine/creatinine deaminase
MFRCFTPVDCDFEFHPPMPDDLTISAVALPGRRGAFELSMRAGRIAAIRPVEPAGEPGWLALPGLVNLHAHADRAFTVQSYRPHSFADALAAAASARAGFTAADVEARAMRLLARSVAHGVTRLRTHTDVDPLVELRSMEGILAAKRQAANAISIEVVAFATSRNDLAEPSALARLEGAVALGADAIGASLNSSADPARALAALLDLAERSGLLVDLHLDEHLEREKMLAPLVADAVMARGLRRRVVLSHLCALAALDANSAAALIDKLARAEISVVALPETNLFLQERGKRTPIRRGITLIRELLAAGVTVRLGTDNVRDWFFPLGDGDMLETARIAAIAAHLEDEAQLIATICDGRATIEEGSVADLVLLRASCFDDVLARLPAERMVFKAGRQVAGPAPS